MTTLQNVILTLQCYIRELKGFAIFFVMHITHTASVLNHYELTSLPCTAAECMNNLAAMARILKQDATQSINYSLAIVCFERLAKHLNAEDTIDNMKMKLLDSCFGEWHKAIENVIGEKEDLLQRG